MTFTKQIAPARQIDAFRAFAAQVKFAYVATKNGEVIVTEMQTNANALDCQWTAKSEIEARASLLKAGYTEVAR
jgi:hypothetical protein